jgi:hypothetical protein
MKPEHRKAYNKEHYIKNKQLYLFRQRARLGILKRYDFDEIYDYYLHANRPLKNPERSKKFQK